MLLLMDSTTSIKFPTFFMTVIKLKELRRLAKFLHLCFTPNLVPKGLHASDFIGIDYLLKKSLVDLTALEAPFTLEKIKKATLWC